MRVQSGSTTTYVSFYAGVTGLSSFTVYRSRNGGTPAAMTSPTVVEADSSNMPGTYWLLLDEDTSIGGSSVTEEMVLYITATGMLPARIVVEFYNPAAYATNVQYVNGVEVGGQGTLADPWGPA